MIGYIARMAVIKEWECAAHGYFDGTEAVCPHGCPQQFVQRVFLTPPGIKSHATKMSDFTLKGLAKDFGMTDIRNGSDGEAVAQATPAASASFKPQWQSLGKNFDVRGMGIEPGNALQSLQPSMKGPKPGEILGRFDG